ncbi:MAG: hypothetical protein PHX51_04125 [Clostridia bacterium]|nr:hypothetical protein [Clostridia bacterium]
MGRITVGAGIANERYLRYISRMQQGTFYLNGLEIEDKGDRLELVMDFDDQFIREHTNYVEELICDCVCYGKKPEYFADKLGLDQAIREGTLPLVDEAILFAVTLFDAQSDRASVIDKLNIGDQVNIDGLLNFKIFDVVNKWQETADTIISNCLLLHDKAVKTEFLSEVMKNTKRMIKNINVNFEKDDFNMMSNCIVLQKALPILDCKFNTDAEVIYNLLYYMPKCVTLNGEHSAEVDSLTHCIFN